jgi:hypothetical protein
MFGFFDAVYDLRSSQVYISKSPAPRPTLPRTNRQHAYRICSETPTVLSIVIQMLQSSASGACKSIKIFESPVDANYMDIALACRAGVRHAGDASASASGLFLRFPTPYSMSRTAFSNPV